MKNNPIIHFVIPFLWVLVLNIFKDLPPVIFKIENKTILLVTLFVILLWVTFDVAQIRNKKVLLYTASYTLTGLIMGGIVSNLFLTR